MEAEVSLTSKIFRKYFHQHLACTFLNVKNFYLAFSPLEFSTKCTKQAEKLIFKDVVTLCLFTSPCWRICDI